jgi:hypothetical protein
VPSLGMTAKLLFRLALLSVCFLSLPLHAQQAEPGDADPKADTGTKSNPTATAHDTYDLRNHWMPGSGQGYFFSRPRADSASFDRVAWTSTPGTIQRMESAVYCNDTPFIDQVRFPLATLWRGRLKLVGFESDVTTANFVLGLPGQGALHNLSAFGNGFIATHTPPSDQLAGIHMIFSLRASGYESSENSGLHGIEYLVHASRNAFPFFNARSDGSQNASR